MSTKASADRSNTTSTTTTITEDNRVAASEGAIAIGSRGTYINTFSPEVAKVATQLITFVDGAAKSSISAVQQSAQNAMQYGRDTEKQALDLVANVTQTNPLNATIVEKITPAVTVAAIVLGIAYIFKKR